jgi:predicted RNA-binding protein YlxR (DUF448 family)
VAPKPTLVRLALGAPSQSGRRTAVLDRAQRLPGRGAYLCPAGSAPRPAAACLQAALKRGGLSRAFRASVSIDDDFVESSL